MYNLLEYSSNYSDSISLWLYSKDEAANFNADIAKNNAFQSFKYKAQSLGNTEPDVGNRILINTAIAASLKFLSIFGDLLK